MRKLIDAYAAYWQTNADIKERQRAEREAELQPYLNDLGREINESGLNISEVAKLLERRDRTFLYRAKTSHKPKGSTQAEQQKQAPEQPTYQITYGDDGAQVTYGGKSYFVGVTEDGIDLPPAWLEDSQPVHFQIIKEIKEHVRNGV